jgi:Monooxygenase af470-like
MADPPERKTVDLSALPDLVVIYLGMRVEEPRGLETLQILGPQIEAAVGEQPDGLLLHEPLTYSDDPLHIGMRQYWRDFDSLQAWSLTLPHKRWWTDYLRDRGGTSFWHETYFRRGGFESIYVDAADTGMAQFAPRRPATGPMFAARDRAMSDRSGAGASA